MQGISSQLVLSKPPGKKRSNLNGNGKSSSETVEAEPTDNKALDDLMKHAEGLQRAYEEGFGHLVRETQDAASNINNKVGEQSKNVLDGAQKAINDVNDTISKAFASKKQSDTMQKAEIVVQMKYGLAKGPEILLICLDGRNKQQIVVDWTDSFEDVLFKLRDTFKKDVIFEYEKDSQVFRVETDEAFDRAMEVAEASNCKLEVVIQQAVWLKPPMEEEEPDEPEPELELRAISCADRMMYNPAPYKALLGLGIAGMAISIAGCVVGYSVLEEGAYLGAISIFVALPYFVKAFLVKKDFSLAWKLMQFLLALFGLCLAIISCLNFLKMKLQDGVIGCIIWIFSLLFFLWITSLSLYESYKSLKTATKQRRSRRRRIPLSDRIKNGAIGVSLAVVYVLVFGLLQYAPFNHISQIVLTDGYVPLGNMYDRGDGEKNHMHCMAFIDPNSKLDARPVVILEAMEGLGMSTAMAGVQQRIALVGVACAYDRAGFGWSPPAKTARTPTQIASELRTMLSANVTVDIIPRRGNTTRTSMRLKAPYVLVGHSVGSFYVRAFANSFPELTAALVMWDALPSEDETFNQKFKSSASTLYSLPMLQLCKSVLEPMGIIDLFLRQSLLTSILNGTALDQPAPNGIGSDYGRMVSRMLRRSWCPAVAQEYRDLYLGSKPGIFDLVTADTSRYNIPFVIWARSDSIFSKVTAYTIDGLDACLQQFTEILNPDINHPEGTSSWDCVQFKVLHYSKKPYTNPYKRTCEIVGQAQLGSNNPCPDILRSISNGTEIAPLQDASVQAELVDTVLNAWNLLGFSTAFPSNPFALTFQGFVPGTCFRAGCLDSPQQWRSKFAADVAAVLGVRFQGLVQVVVLEGPTACPVSVVTSASAEVIGQLKPGECPKTVCSDVRSCSTPWSLGFSETSWRRSERNLLAKKEERGEEEEVDLRAFAEESFYAVVQLLGVKDSDVQAAMDVLQCVRTQCETHELNALEARGSNENTTAIRLAERNRRDEFFLRYNVTSVLLADRILESNQWNVTSRSIIFECPANSYKYLSGCRQCPANSTSPPGSLEQTSCLCDPNFFLQVVGSDYICVHCPPNSRSVCGSTRIQDCKCDQGYTGEDGKTCSACPLNTYKTVVGNFPCTWCNATQVGCAVPTYPTAEERQALENCHAVVVSTPGFSADHVGTVVHPLFGNISMNADFGTNCTYAAPTIGACVNATVEFSGRMEAVRSMESCLNPPVQPTVNPYLTIIGGQEIIMQRCLKKGDFGCEVYANLSLQHWPVTSICSQCEPGMDTSPVCCFSAHLNLRCTEVEFGGAPGHCQEVSALELLNEGRGQTCRNDTLRII